ncbi:glycosyltransferase family 117 protein [Halpernia frigidisoli]|uniref:DUF2723 domain-containing protein n=1 Tax=Halpernia frigidisoli TaxID=1125876 RepID=A0A1I3DBL3_9FLAO|nr:DUF2723 domain-containing protein [Halpernia frigidisoli]SFH84083.1 Protein of unknown function [Halpernia frigidisoli]
MKNWSFRKWNNILGWSVFVISFFTYLSTIEPNFSFWDCGEYISSAVKLQVTHAPGAALFQLVGAVFAMFALGNPDHYSIVINAMSALFSAFTILFLFWTVTHLIRRMFHKEFAEVTRSEEITILFSGLVGALCFAFSDSFWFSAVEGEVYSMASLFIALILWLITKWENEFHDDDNERWIILIFFIVGLSVGVHMMCMLVIPAVCLIYYARNYTFSWKSFLIANFVTLIILALVFKGVFPFVMAMFGKLEIFFVNGLGLPFHSGTILGFLILIGLSYLIIRISRKSSKRIYQTISLSLVYMIIGFSCWMVIPIRANANPPMNLNNPDNAIGMLDYYNRAQYGDWPTSYGQNYTAYLDPNGIQKNEDGSFKTKKTDDVYEKDESTGTYRKTGERFDYIFSKEQVSFMPRMFSEDKDVMSNYISMYGAPDFSFNYDNPDIADNPQAKQAFDEMRKKYEDGSIKVSDYMQAKSYDLVNVQRPSLGQNLNYFFTFQNGYYFARYLMWNFVGRQNDLQGQMENTNGNWISGIPFIDNYFWGNQQNMPAKFKNESTVAFFFLPFLLGLIGFFFQLNKDFGRFYAILALFVLTSVGIIFYTGMKPFEPRERDYALVGSFYAFAIWIGLGAAAVIWFLNKKVKNNTANIVAGVVLLGVPFMMGYQNYNVHDRSNRYTAYDYSYSSLKSLPKDDILFVYGDNDTYPVWALQETSEFRPDVKVVNFTLLSTPWNIDQVKRRTYNSMPVPSQLNHLDYRDGTNDQIYLMTKKDWQTIFSNLKESGAPDTAMSEYRKYLTQDSMTFKDAMNFIKSKSEDKNDILKMVFGDEKYDKYNFIPCSKFILPVNKANAVKSGILKPHDAAKAVDQIMITYKSNSMFKNNLLMMDILANFDWNRPINFSSGGIYDDENIFYMQDFLQFDGFSYRLTPLETKQTESGDMGRVDADNLYKIVKNYRWGNFKDLNAHFDETCTQNIISYRNSASRAAEALALNGEKNKAIEILDLAAKEIPVKKYNDPRSLSSMVYGYIVSGQEQKGLKLAEELKKGIFTEYDYYASLTPQDQKYLGRQMRTKPMEYSIVVGAVADAYKKIGNETKAYDYLVKSIIPIDKRFSTFIKDLKEMGKVKAMDKSEDVQKITPFYQYLFEVMKPYDSTYTNEKLDQISNDLIKATQ